MEMLKNLTCPNWVLLGFLSLTLLLVTGPGRASADDFDRYIMPVSNPVYSGDARNISVIRPIFIYQNLPEEVQTIVGKVPLDGNVKVYALQATLALSDRLSIVAVKDGYVDCNPRYTLSDHDGFADLAAGLQYSFIYDPTNSFILSGRLVYELPTGSDKVYQGNGDGNLAPSVQFLKGIGDLQLSGSLGFVIPLDSSAENTLLYDAWHASYAVTDWFFPLVELNHFYVLDSGDRDIPDSGLGAIGTRSEDDLVAGIAEFNGCDLINLGGSYNDNNRNLTTLAVGARFRVLEWLDFGAAYEFALTDDSKGMLDDRYQLDAVVSLPF